MSGYVQRLLVVLLCFTPSALAADMPSGGTQILPSNALRHMNFKPADNRSRLVYGLIPVQGPRFDRAMRVRTKVTPDMPYQLSLTVPVDAAIDQRKTYLLDVWIRCPETADEAGVGRFNLVVEQNKPHWAKVVQKRGTAGREWRRILHPFKPRRSLPAGEAHFAVHLGQSFAPTVFDFAQVRLWEYPASVEPRNLPTTRYSYPGRERDAAWRAEAQQRIREHRMTRADITVVNAAGRPVTGAKVTARMQSHAFRFGTAVQATLIGMDEGDFPYRKQARISGGLSEWDWSNAQKYRETLRKYFNRVVFEGALRPWVFYNNDRRREHMFASLPWLENHGLDVRGHFLTLGLIKGRRVDRWGDNPEGYKREMFRYIEDVVPQLGERIAEWDVIGHPVTGEPDLPDLVKDPNIHTEIMRRARAVAPSDVELYVVEGGILANRNNSNDYYAFIRKLIDDGQRPDGIAFMGHFEAGGLRSMDYLYESMDRFAPLADEIQITELDVNAPGDEKLQADYLRDVMIMAFSHPKMGGITHWGFWAGRHWKPTAALWRTDWSIRPAGQAYLDLVFNQWWTNETGETNGSGLWSFHGFHGDYEIAVKSEGKTSTYTFRLKEGTGELHIRLE